MSCIAIVTCNWPVIIGQFLHTYKEAFLFAFEFVLAAWYLIWYLKGWFCTYASLQYENHRESATIYRMNLATLQHFFAMQQEFNSTQFSTTFLILAEFEFCKHSANFLISKIRENSLKWLRFLKIWRKCEIIWFVKYARIQRGPKKSNGIDVWTFIKYVKIAKEKKKSVPAAIQFHLTFARWPKNCWASSLWNWTVSMRKMAVKKFLLKML